MPHPMIRVWEYSWSASGRSPRTMVEMKPFVERFEEVLAVEGRTLETATPSDCAAFLSDLPTPNRRAWAWRSLRSFFATVTEELDQPSPMAKIKAPKVPLTDVKVATADDVTKMLRACSPWSTATNARDAAIISTLWSSGMRRSELARLTVEDVDLDGLNILIRTSKTGKPRRAPIDERTVQHIARWLTKRAQYPVDAGEFLWVGKQGPLTSDGVRQAIERRAREAGVDVSCHAFRRGWTVHSIGQRGISQASVMVAAGWSPNSGVMVSRYTRTHAEGMMMSEFANKPG